MGENAQFYFSVNERFFESLNIKPNFFDCTESPKNDSLLVVPLQLFAY